MWALIEKYKINVHPAYRLGFGRTSCLHCIFGGPEQRAAGRAVDPAGFARHAAYEVEFEHTIHRKLTVVQIADTVRWRVWVRGRSLRGFKLVEAATVPEAVAKFRAKYAKTFNLHDKEAIDVEPAAYKLDPRDVAAAMSTTFDEPIIMDPWVLPQGAFGDSCGPT